MSPLGKAMLNGPERMRSARRSFSIAWPGQALAYKLGQMKIIELRERARQQLGERFNLRAFHDALLGDGPLPLDVLESNTDRWIAAQKSVAPH